jgi:hypothetical protein
VETVEEATKDAPEATDAGQRRRKAPRSRRSTLASLDDNGSRPTILGS